MVGILRFLPTRLLPPSLSRPAGRHAPSRRVPSPACTHQAPCALATTCGVHAVGGNLGTDFCLGQRSHRASYQYRGAAWPRGARSTQGTPPPLAGVPRCGQPRSRGASLARNATRHQAHEGGRAHTHRHATPSSRRRLGHSQRPQLQLSRATARSEPRDQPRVPALLHECARGVCHSPRPNLAERSAQFSN